MKLIQQRYGENWREALVTETPQTLEELKSIFELIDADNSGLLDRDEILQLADFFTEKTMTEAEIDEAMREMDADGSGEVDFEEFSVRPCSCRIRCVVQVMIPTPICLLAVFASIWQTLLVSIV